MLDCWSRGCGLESHSRLKLKFLSCAHSPDLLSPYGKMSTGFQWQGSSTYSWDLKYGSTSFADWLWSVIALALGFKTIPDLQDTNSTHTGIAYAHLTAPGTCDYMGYVQNVGHSARSCKNHLWLLRLEYAKFSLYEKWNNCPHPYQTIIA